VSALTDAVRVELLIADHRFCIFGDPCHGRDRLDHRFRLVFETGRATIRAIALNPYEDRNVPNYFNDMAQDRLRYHDPYNRHPDNNRQPDKLRGQLQT